MTRGLRAFTAGGQPVVDRRPEADHRRLGHFRFEGFRTFTRLKPFIAQRMRTGEALGIKAFLEQRRDRTCGSRTHADRRAATRGSRRRLLRFFDPLPVRIPREIVCPLRFASLLDADARLLLAPALIHCAQTPLGARPHTDRLVS